MTTYHTKNLTTINDLRHLIIEFFKDKETKIYLFGSRARGDNMEYSDVDLAFISKHPILKHLTLLREIIENSNLPYHVDLVDLTRNNNLKKTVLKEGTRWL